MKRTILFLLVGLILMSCSTTRQTLALEKTPKEIDSLRQELILVNQKLEREKDLTEILQKEKDGFIKIITELKNKIKEKSVSKEFSLKQEKEKSENQLKSRIKVLSEKNLILKNEIASLESWEKQILEKSYFLNTKNNQLEKEKRETETLYQEAKLARKKAETFCLFILILFAGFAVIMSILLFTLYRKKR